jgi:hypothetical protein
MLSRIARHYVKTTDIPLWRYDKWILL